MLELVHQHAPDATLGFCDGLDLDFNGCIKDLADTFHADIIVDDILFAGQFYPDSSADIVGQREAANDRLVFIHLAGNEQRGGYWRGQFAPTQAQVNGAVNHAHAALAQLGVDFISTVSKRPTDPTAALDVHALPALCWFRGGRL